MDSKTFEQLFPDFDEISLCHSKEYCVDVKQILSWKFE